MTTMFALALDPMDTLLKYAQAGIEPNFLAELDAKDLGELSQRITKFSGRHPAAASALDMIEKHMRGSHDQSSHGRGDGGATRYGSQGRGAYTNNGTLDEERTTAPPAPKGKDTRTGTTAGRMETDTLVSTRKITSGEYGGGTSTPSAPAAVSTGKLATTSGRGRATNDLLGKRSLGPQELGQGATDPRPTNDRNTGNRLGGTTGAPTEKGEDNTNISRPEKNSEYVRRVLDTPGNTPGKNVNSVTEKPVVGVNGVLPNSSSRQARATTEAIYGRNQTAVRANLGPGSTVTDHTTADIPEASRDYERRVFNPKGNTLKVPNYQ